jgi:hypothetical protein
MDNETANKQGKVSYAYYKRVMEEYLIPALGNCNITNIDAAAIDELDARRIELLEKVPSHSTILKHNAALNRVFDEAVMRGFLTEANRPKLDAKGKTGDRRPAFDLEELQSPKKTKKKLYSWHAEEAECNSKGKARKPYEFGVKVGIVTTMKGNLIIGARTFPNNPYDGHTLAEQLEQANILANDQRCVRGSWLPRPRCGEGMPRHQHQTPRQVQ